MPELPEVENIALGLKQAIRAGGTTFSDYRNAYGDMGQFRRRLRVYGRTGLPCRRCASPIVKTVIAGRGTHFCGQCQSDPMKTAHSRQA